MAYRFSALAKIVVICNKEIAISLLILQKVIPGTYSSTSKNNWFSDELESSVKEKQKLRLRWQQAARHDELYQFNKVKKKVLKSMQNYYDGNRM